jgi:membrane-associated protease RseP (regulator of RpoE activity)
MDENRGLSEADEDRLTDDGESRRETILFFGLFAVTVATTFAAGIGFAGADFWEQETWTNVETLFEAASYCVGVIAILYAHEMGHYLLCKRHEVDASRPFFLPGIGPIPDVGLIPSFGTFGAFIKLKLERVPARHLLEIGAWGPLAGFAVTIPVLFLGFFLSEVQPLPEDLGDAVMLGDSLILMLCEAIFHPDIPEGHDVFLHPLAMAGWVGCLLTALNLLPIGQLDGGHIAYATFGDSYRWTGRVFFCGLVVVGICLFPGWLVMAGLVYFLGVDHPEMLEDEPQGKPSGLALSTLLVFILTFAPQPIKVGGLLAYFSDLVSF